MKTVNNVNLIDIHHIVDIRYGTYAIQMGKPC